MLERPRTASTGIVVEAAFLSVGGVRRSTARLGWDRAATCRATRESGGTSRLAMDLSFAF